MQGEPRYGSDFKHPDYVDPDAPKGGTLIEARIGSFDSLNRWIITGAYNPRLRLTYDQLMQRAENELVAAQPEPGQMAQMATAFETRFGIKVQVDRKVGVVGTQQFATEERVGRHVMDVNYSADPAGKNSQQLPMTPWAREKLTAAKPPFGDKGTFDNPNDPVQKYCDSPGLTRLYAYPWQFTIVQTPANVYMLQRADLFAIPVWVLVARLPLQVALLALILWSTRPTATTIPKGAPELDTHT